MEKELEKKIHISTGKKKMELLFPSNQRND